MTTQIKSRTPAIIGQRYPPAEARILAPKKIMISGIAQQAIIIHIIDELCFSLLFSMFVGNSFYDLLLSGILLRVAVEMILARPRAEVVCLAFVLALILRIGCGELHAADEIKERIRLFFDMKADLIEK